MRMKKFTCPYCYGKHTIKDCKMKCSFDMVISGKKYTCKKDIEKTAEDETAEATRNAEGWIPEALYAKCFKCQEASKRIFCPIVYEKKGEDEEGEIPRIFLSNKNLPIALIGAKNSGKSHYIGVLIDEIRRKMPLQFNCVFDICCSETSEKQYRKNYEKPLFVDGHILDSTLKGEKIPPMIFPLEFMGKKFISKKNRIKNMAILTFYDTAGENLESGRDIEINNKYIPNAKGIILLLDPLQVPSIREKLGMPPMPLKPEKESEKESEKCQEAEKVLSKVMENIRNVKNIGSKDKINIPIALVFTKIDILEQANDILPSDSCLREESKHLERGGFVLSDYENTNIEMGNFLENWLDKEKGIVKKLEQFSKYSIFGVSSLGANPNGNKLSGKPNPRRVLDPLLWLLAENKYIKTIGRR